MPHPAPAKMAKIMKLAAPSVDSPQNVRRFWTFQNVVHEQMKLASANFSQWIIGCSSQMSKYVEANGNAQSSSLMVKIGRKSGIFVIYFLLIIDMLQTIEVRNYFRPSALGKIRALPYRSLQNRI
jgi:hypothetical protein